jgi:hypothetical protein
MLNPRFIHPEDGNSKICQNIRKSPFSLCGLTMKADQMHRILAAKASVLKEIYCLLSVQWNERIAIHDTEEI